MSCGVGRTHSSDLMLLWLWRQLAAVAAIQPLAWELPYATGAALKSKRRSCCCGAVETNLTRNHEVQVRSLASLSGLRIGIAMSCGVGHRCSSDPMLLWLWCGLMASALIQPLAWKPPRAAVRP